MGIFAEPKNTNPLLLYVNVISTAWNHCGHSHKGFICQNHLLFNAYGVPNNILLCGLLSVLRRCHFNICSYADLSFFTDLSSREFDSCCRYCLIFSSSKSKEGTPSQWALPVQNTQEIFLTLQLKKEGKKQHSQDICLN